MFTRFWQTRINHLLLYFVLREFHQNTASFRHKLQNFWLTIDKQSSCPSKDSRHARIFSLDDSASRKHQKLRHRLEAMSSDQLVSSQRGAEHLFVWQHLLSAQLCRFFWHAQRHNYSLMPCPFQRSFLPGLFQHVSSGFWMHLDCHSPSLMPSQVLKCRPFLESNPVECPQLGTRSPGCNPARDRTPMLLTSPTLSMHHFSLNPWPASLFPMQHTLASSVAGWGRARFWLSPSRSTHSNCAPRLHNQHWEEHPACKPGESGCAQQTSTCSFCERKSWRAGLNPRDEWPQHGPSTNSPPVSEMSVGSTISTMNRHKWNLSMFLIRSYGVYFHQIQKLWLVLVKKQFVKMKR